MSEPTIPSKSNEEWEKETNEMFKKRMRLWYALVTIMVVIGGLLVWSDSKEKNGSENNNVIIAHKNTSDYSYSYNAPKLPFLVPESEFLQEDSNAQPVGGNTFYLITAGSGSPACAPQAEKASYDASKNTLTVTFPKNTDVCTEDYVHYVSAITLPEGVVVDSTPKLDFLN